MVKNGWNTCWAVLASMPVPVSETTIRAWGASALAEAAVGRRVTVSARVPEGVTTAFSGAAQAFQDTQKGLLALFVVAIFVIYIVLGILYESFIHPITILSGIPFAALGALLAAYVLSGLLAGPDYGATLHGLIVPGTSGHDGALITGIAVVGTIESVTLEDWRRVQDINVDGTFLGCRHAVRAMKPPAGRGGAIINLSSVSGIVGGHNLAAYNASKGAVRMFTKSVALECAAAKDNVRVNSLHPGIVETAIWDTLIGTGPEGSNARPRTATLSAFTQNAVPLGRPGRLDEVANAIIAQMLFLQMEDPKKDIHLYINSPGGVVTGGMAIYDTMNFLQCDIVTYCIGMAASMSTVLLAAGTKGKRFALPNSRVMIHQPSGGAGGQTADIAIAAKEILRWRQTLNQTIPRHTGKTAEQVEKDSDRDYYMSAQEAKDYGIVDHVVESTREAQSLVVPSAA